MAQSLKLQLFNYLFTEFSRLDVPVIKTKDLDQALSYPFIAIQGISDSIQGFTFDSFGGNPTATIHIWGVEDNVLDNDELSSRVQSLLLNDIELDGYQLYDPQININETTVQETNQSLSHVVMNVEYQAH
ncbi:hypothetical protein QI066_12245 [Staphylococcus saprophyticus]|nr:hypothetical protein [Staphylococcus saprophyticus]